jgi:uncharacterized membrane protein
VGRAGSVIAGLVLSAVVLGVAYSIGKAEFPFSRWIGLAVAIIGMAVVVYLTYRGFRAHPEQLALTLAAVSGTLTNTGLVLLALVLLGSLPAAVALAVGLANGPLEMVAASMVTVAVVAGWRQIEIRPGGASV